MSCRASRLLIAFAFAASGAAAAATPVTSAKSGTLESKPGTPESNAALGPEQRQAEEAAAKQKLEALRTEMRELEAARVATRGEQQEAQKALRETEQAINASARELRRIDTELAERARKLNELEAEAKALAARLGHEKETLATLLRSAYAEGQYAPLLPWLAPDQLADSARVLGYHRVLNEGRAAQIAKIQAELERSKALALELEQARAELDATRTSRAAEAATLESQRQQRRELIASLEQKLSDAAARLKELQANERELLALLERLKDVLADIPKVLAGSEPFAGRRGHLHWPLAGTHVAGFGSPLSDGRKRQGLEIAAHSGTEVHAIAYGRVAYADWLRGYGLIAIVDHGDGYLSLYAHCEALLRDVGDWVQDGEAIATAGSEGMGHAAGLYFELRKDGVALDPGPWLGPAAATNPAK